MSNHIKKFGINYARKFPEHRVPYDFNTYKVTKSSIMDRYKAFTSGFNYGMFRYFHVYGSIFLGFVLGLVGAVKTYGVTTEEVILKYRNNKPALKWAILSNNPKMGRFDIITNKFENQQGGIKDFSDQ